MNKTELFKEGLVKSAANQYRTFIEQNPEITIISVIPLKNENILLTYKD
ncbi:acetate CoA-transferase [Planomicrobium okeanokoites]|nr:acetate CoA-transferase [Planomicrobium okeanokoites]